MFLQLLTMTLQAKSQLDEGKRAKNVANLNSYKLDTEKKMSEVESQQRHNDRLEQYKSNLSSNIAAFAATGRDLGDFRTPGRGTKSVSAFLNRQRDVATDDTARSDIIGRAQSLKYNQQMFAVRAEGQASLVASKYRAFTSVASGLSDMMKTAASGGGN